MVLLNKPDEVDTSKKVQAAYSQNKRFQRWLLVWASATLLVKFVAWQLTASVAILTDVLESLVNLFSAGIGVYSAFLTSKPKDRNHPYGHGKVEFIAAALEGLLISFAGLAMLYEACFKIGEEHQVQQIDLALLLIVFTGLLNLFLGWRATTMGKKNKSSLLIASGAHLLTDTYTTFALLVGLVVMYYTQYYWVDVLLAILFSLLLLRTGWKIIRQSLAGIMDEADPALLSTLVAAMNEKRSTVWIDIHNLRLIKFGGRLHLDCHLVLPWYLQVQEAYQQVIALNALIDQVLQEPVEVFVHLDPCQPFCCSSCLLLDCPHRHAKYKQKNVWTPTNIAQVDANPSQKNNPP